jgi:chromosome segregation ATPase
MASASSSSSAAAASKRAAAEELSLVEAKLEEVNRQLRSLKEERDVLLSRQASLKVQLNSKQEEVDWSGSFEWDAEVVKLKREVFGIEAPFRPMQVGGSGSLQWRDAC